MRKQSGNVMMITLIIITIIIAIFMFVMAIFKSNVNGIIYGVKTDMYLINKSAIIAVNKNEANIDKFTYDKKEYLKYFKESLRKNYNLDENLESEKGLIKKITIDEYQIYKKGQEDNFNNQKCDDNTIHTVITVKIKPIILKKELENIFTFKIHEDVNLNMAKIK